MKVVKSRLYLGAGLLLGMSFLLPYDSPATSQNVYVIGGLVLMWIGTALENDNKNG